MNNEISHKEIANSLDKLQKTFLYLAYAKNGESIKGRTHLQKEMFLVAKFIPEVWELAEFVPYNHGAYSEYVEVSLRDFKSYELIEEENREIVITNFGKNVVRSIEKELSKNEKEAINEFKSFMNDMSFMELLVFSYFSFRDFIGDSAIIKRVRENRLKATLSLYKKGLINLEKAMFISGLNGKQFLELFNKK